MPSHCLLCSGRFCRGFFSRPASCWFWWLRCGPRRSGSPTFCPCWLTNPSNFLRCGTCWYSPTRESSIEVSEPSDFTCGSCPVTYLKGRFFEGGCAGHSCGPPTLHCCLVPVQLDQVLCWCDQRGVDPCKASIPQVAKFFLFLRQDLGLSGPVVKGY